MYALFENRKKLFWVLLTADVTSIIVSCVSAPTVGKPSFAVVTVTVDTSE